MTFRAINSPFSVLLWEILRSHCGQFSLELFSVEEYVPMKMVEIVFV